MALAITRPVLRYHGGKFRLASWIISHFPTHRIYTEAYGGAASVLIQKPRTYSEVYNDLDGEIVNLFRVLRDPGRGAELERLLRLTPYARDEFALSYVAATDPIEQARRTVVRSFMGFASAAASGHQTGFRANSNRSGTTPAHDWANYPDCLALLVQRLAGVMVEHRDALDVLRQHDAPDCLHYVDPPYPRITRSSKGHYDGAYRYEMSDDDHRELAGVLRGLQGMVILSGYPCGLYDCELYPDWERLERRHYAAGAKERTEVLWLNAAAARARAQGRMAL